MEKKDIIKTIEVLASVVNASSLIKGSTLLSDAAYKTCLAANLKT